jgi:hypothetical protein
MVKQQTTSLRDTFKRQLRRLEEYSCDQQEAQRELNEVQGSHIPSEVLRSAKLQRHTEKVDSLVIEIQNIYSLVLYKLREAQDESDSQAEMIRTLKCRMTSLQRDMHQKLTEQDVKVIEAVASIHFGAEQIQDVMSNLHEEEKEQWLERLSRTQRTFTFKRRKGKKMTKTPIGDAGQIGHKGMQTTNESDSQVELKGTQTTSDGDGQSGFSDERSDARESTKSDEDRSQEQMEGDDGGILGNGGCVSI